MASENHLQYHILQQEACLFSRYLIDREPTQDIIDLYVKAGRKLRTDIILLSDENILNFTMSKPWSIPFLDAATGFLQRDSLLRKKIYTMAAVLEASPRFVEDFMPRTYSPAVLFFQILSSTLAAGLKTMIGIPLLLIIRRRKRD